MNPRAARPLAEGGTTGDQESLTATLSRILSVAFSEPFEVSSAEIADSSTPFTSVCRAATSQGPSFSFKVPRVKPFGARDEVLVNQLAFALGIPSSAPARLLEPIPQIGPEFAGANVAVLWRRPDDYQPIASQESSIREKATLFLKELATWATFLAATGTVDRHEYNILWSEPRALVTEVDFEESFLAIGDFVVQLECSLVLSGLRDPTFRFSLDNPRVMALEAGLLRAHDLLVDGQPKVLRALRESGLDPEITNRVMEWVELGVDAKTRVLREAIRR